MNTGTVPDGSEPAGPGAAPPSAVHLFGASLPQAQAFADLLAGDGVEHGHIGPREVPRLWARHLVNSAVLTDLLPEGARFLDVGSGAGLPGIPMALRRPDLAAVLLEPMVRRIRFLEAAVDRLGLSERVQVVRGRADDAAVRRQHGGQDWVVARAVAPLDRLVRWSLPLVRPGGALLALKGERAESEVAEFSTAVLDAGGEAPTLVPLGTGDDRTWAVRVERSVCPGSATRGRR